MDIISMPKQEVKKHVSTVHINGDLNLVQRKTANVLLFNAYLQKQKGARKYQIRLQDLCELIGYDSKDLKHIKESLIALTDVKVEWDVLGDKKKKGEWGVATLLAGVKIPEGEGIVYYDYSQFLEEKIFNPEIYTTINLRIQRQFSSRHALALYENCLRFQKVGSTGFIDLAIWRSLFGLEEGSYDQYKELNKFVLKQAIKEINEVSDIHIFMETQRQGRSISALKFHIEKNPQIPLDMEVPAHSQKALECRLKEDFAISENRVKELISGFDEERITRNLDYVEAEIRGGKKIGSLGAYTYKAIAENYRPPLSKLEELERVQAEAKTKEKLEAKNKAEAKKKEAETTAKKRTQDAFVWFEGLPEADQITYGGKLRAKATTATQKRLLDTLPLLEAVKGNGMLKGIFVNLYDEACN